MGHLTAKDPFTHLGRRLESLSLRAPYTVTLRSILEELYTEREARIVASMPATLSSLKQLERLTRIAASELELILEGLCSKGLVIDLWFEGALQRLYTPSPFVIGIFEFTMMRAASDADHRRRARLFQEYWATFVEANYGDGQQVALLRTLPHEAAVAAAGSVEILDYERASYLVARAERFAVGICSCRHEKLHLGNKSCDVPLESCTALDRSADYLVRRGLAREISRTEMQKLIDRSREIGLVMNADNVRKSVGYICHCCTCCCNMLRGITELGYPNVIVSSTLAATVDDTRCAGCGKCQQHCPVAAIDVPPTMAHGQRRHTALVREQDCLGCGLCVSHCSRHALSLVPRRRRVLHPESTFERVLLTALERGTLEQLVFDNPNSRGHAFIRAFLGGFLRLVPVKQAIVSDRFRSVFLSKMKRLADGTAAGRCATSL
jgi:Pyruvate/2-oxoacid:ferredoxin oxidoreductase delta subunit